MVDVPAASSAARRLLTKLDQVRRERGLSWQRLSSRTDVPASTLHYWMRHAQRLPSWDQLRKVVCACGEPEGLWLRAWRHADRLYNAA